MGRTGNGKSELLHMRPPAHTAASIEEQPEAENEGGKTWEAPSWIGIHQVKRGYHLQHLDESGQISMELARRIGPERFSQPQQTARSAITELCRELDAKDGLLRSDESIDLIAYGIHTRESDETFVPSFSMVPEEDKERFRRVAKEAIAVAGLSPVVDQETSGPKPELGDTKRFLPDHPEAREYYEALRRKHFSDDAVGSRFVGPFGLEDMVEALPDVSEDIPLSEQDDRAYFQSQGITGLKDDLGYFRIPAAGYTRLVPDSEISPDEEIEIEEVKPGFFSFITSAEHEVLTREATMIVGRNPRGDTPFQVVTTFPGLPWEPERSGISVEEAKKRGISPGKMTLSRLRELVGGDLLLQSR